MTDYIALVEPDDRGRIPLRRFLRRSGTSPSKYKLFIEDGGKRIVLEEVDSLG